MKTTFKPIFLLGLLVFLNQTAMAQDNRDFRVGFKVIPGFDWVKSNSTNVQKNGMGIGYSFGVMADYAIGTNYYFSSEVNITNMTNSMKLKGDTIGLLLKNGDSFNNISYKYNLKYIEIPLMFKFRTKESNLLRYWGQFGIAPGFLISKNVGISASSLETPSSNFPIDEKFNPNDVSNNQYDFKNYSDNVSVLRASMILGAGIEYNLHGNTSFYCGLRFNNGFTDMLRDKKSKMVNNVLGLEIGFFF